jgi:AcrR family transcriptional regulator
MAEAPLTAERILEASEDVLRRYGPAKANVIDVARELGVSHGSVYRHFPSKAALRDAVAERWLHAIAEPLATLADEPGPAPERLRRWLRLLVSSKRARALDDPELFATYTQLAGESREVITAHIKQLISQLARIISDGVDQGTFAVEDTEAAARAAFDATGRFHNPAHASEWSDPKIDDHLEGVLNLVLRGLGGSSLRR